MQHLGVDTGIMTVVDMACGAGGALTRMLANGNVLLNGDEKEEIGVLSSDLITTKSCAARPRTTRV